MTIPIKFNQTRWLHPIGWQKETQQLFSKLYTILAVHSDFAPKIVCGLLYVNTSKICSMPKIPRCILIQKKSPVCIQPVYLASCFLQCNAHHNQNLARHLLSKLNETSTQTNKKFFFLLPVCAKCITGNVPVTCWHRSFSILYIVHTVCSI